MAPRVRRRAVRRRRPARRNMRRKIRSTRYKDVHSFKLQANETIVFNSGSIGIPNVSTKGPGLGIGNLTFGPAGGVVQTARFGGVYVSTANATTQWSQLNTLFDRYKIHGVRLTFIPEWNVQFIGQGTIPVMKVVKDYDDATVPSVGDVWARQGREYRLNRPFSVYIRPKVGNALYNGALTTAYSVQKAPYINTSYAAVPHWGLKFAVKDWVADQGSFYPNCTLRVEATYYMSFREQINIGAVGHTGEEAADEIEQNAELVEDVACELKPAM